MAPWRRREARVDGLSDSDHRRRRSRRSDEVRQGGQRRSNSDRRDEDGAGVLGTNVKEDSRRDKRMMDGRSRDDRNDIRQNEQSSSSSKDSDSYYRRRRPRCSDDGPEERDRRSNREHHKEDGDGNLGAKLKEDNSRDKEMVHGRSQDDRKYSRREEHSSSSSEDYQRANNDRRGDRRDDRERRSNQDEDDSNLGAEVKEDKRRDKAKTSERSRYDRKHSRREEHSPSSSEDSDSDAYRGGSKEHNRSGSKDRRDDGERRSKRDEKYSNLPVKLNEDSDKVMLDGRSQGDRKHNHREEHSSSSSEDSDYDAQRGRTERQHRRGTDDRGDDRVRRSSRDEDGSNSRAKKNGYERDNETDGQAQVDRKHNLQEYRSLSSDKESEQDAHRRSTKDDYRSRTLDMKKQTDGRYEDRSEDRRELNGGRDSRLGDHQSRKREREQKSDADALSRKDRDRNRAHNEIDRENQRDRYRHRDPRSDNRERRRDDINGSPRKENRRDSDCQIRERDRDRHNQEETKKQVEAALPLPPALPEGNLGRSGGIYIPPHKMAQMMREVQDKNSEAYQRMSWDALRKSINGLVNKVNATNIKNIIPELFSENLIRGRGLFCRSCMKSQMASPGFTDVFAALVAVVNTKFPEVGKLLLKRIVLQLKRAYKRNDKPQLLAATKFIAHLVNQQVAHEIIALELLTVLLENPTDDSVEVAVGFVKECGSLLQDFSPLGLHGIFERFRGILHEGEIDKRVQFLIEGLFAIRKAKFQGYPAIRPELDLVEQEDQFTHEISLEDEVDPETHLDVFKVNPQFLDDEKAYENLKRNILGAESSEDEEDSDAGSGDDDNGDDDDDDEEEEGEDEEMKIKDETETNLVNLRRTIYLTIMSSVDFEEAGHKLLKIKLEPGQEMELCIMLLECCSQERTYLRYYGLLGQRFCMINKVHQENFEKCFVQQYSMIHRLETNKLRNVAKFFAHLLGTSALSWHVLAYIRLTEEDTTSSSRIFIKILFQELSEHLGIRLLNERLNDPTMQESFESIFPKDNPKNTRFSINFFTSIGLGGITENLREYLKNMPRLIMQQQKPMSESESASESASDSDSGNSDSQAESGSESESVSRSESESSSDGSERDRRRKKRKRN